MNSDIDFDKEWQKMLSGEVYEASHTKFLERLVRTKSILREFNALPADD